jgi:alkylhydroperoxidase family enzyme
MWIQTVAPEHATGLLKRLYDAAVGRAGKVASILRSMSLNPPVLRTALALYRDVMFGQSPLSRSQREMLATAVSVFNQCEY